jgi:hypothetical protein
MLPPKNDGKELLSNGGFKQILGSVKRDTSPVVKRSDQPEGTIAKTIFK